MRYYTNVTTNEVNAARNTNNKSFKVGTTFSWAQWETGGGKDGQVIQVSNKHN